MNPEISALNLRVQYCILLTGILLFLLKLAAYWITHSLVVLSDALESTVNLTAAILGLYSLYLSSLPRDDNHPYGHGKVEFISSALEGGLIIFAGLIIMYEAVERYLTPKPLHDLDYGLLLVFISGIMNWVMGWYSQKIGYRNQSLPLISSGQHLKTDAYSTFGIVFGLLFVHFSELEWIDSLLAFVLGGYIIFPGYKIVRSAIAGIMDETDEVLLKEISEELNQNRKSQWIDIQNFRIIKYGAILHIDCHLTLPWYWNVLEAHEEIDAISNLLRKKYGNFMECFIHIDACKPVSCEICSIENCIHRKKSFQKQILWTSEVLMRNQKHQKD